MSEVAARVAGLLHSVDISDGDRAAIGLLAEYADGYWLNVPDFVPCILTAPAGDPYDDWDRAINLLGRTRSGHCHLAVLLMALHLGGRDVAGLALGSWLPHLSREALAAVVRAVVVAAGARAEVKDAGDHPLVTTRRRDHG